MALWSENHWTSAFRVHWSWSCTDQSRLSPELKVEFDHPSRWMEDRNIHVYHCVPISAKLFDICLLRFLDCGDFYMDVGPWRAILPGNLHTTRSGAPIPNESSVVRVCEVRVPSSLLWITQSPGFPTILASYPSLPDIQSHCYHSILVCCNFWTFSSSHVQHPRHLGWRIPGPLP